MWIVIFSSQTVGKSFNLCTEPSQNKRLFNSTSLISALEKVDLLQTASHAFKENGTLVTVLTHIGHAFLCKFLKECIVLKPEISGIDLNRIRYTKCKMSICACSPVSWFL